MKIHNFYLLALFLTSTLAYTNENQEENNFFGQTKKRALRPTCQPPYPYHSIPQAARQKLTEKGRAFIQKLNQENKSTSMNPRAENSVEIMHNYYPSH